MCGIAALVSRTRVRAYPIRRMMDLVRHRGPDDEGYLTATASDGVALFGGPSTPPDAFASGLAFAPSHQIETAEHATATVALGFRRLAILDLSVRGHQPMCTPDRRNWIVFNGEIYNYRELGDELARLGHKFVSHSDTEVLLAAYAEWGTACFARLDGMWACLIYDAAAGEVIASRDRFGIKPLYYWGAPNGTLCFASEIKQFTAASGWTGVVNARRATQFLDTGLTDDGDETLFDRVFQLGPGELARVPIATFQVGADGRLHVERWYSLEPASFSGSFEDAVQQCRQLLTDSVGLMLRSDVPVGSCLSGGIDSSSVVCLSHRLLTAQGVTGQHRTFSAVAPSTAIDERAWIDDVVRATGVESYYVAPASADLAAAAARLAWHQDEPVSGTSVFAQWCVFELAAANGMKVMLDGQGADEAFAGYHSFFAPYLAGVIRDGRFVDAWAEIGALKNRHDFGVLRALRGTARALIGAGDSGAVGVAALSHAQLTRRNLQMLLRFEDRNSMAHSVEARVPFLDHRLVEFALGLPDAFKLGGGVTKRVLRAAMSGVLPDRIRDRVDKIAFETPESSWLTGDLRGWCRAELEQVIAMTDRFVPASTLARFDAMASGARPYDRGPWRAISLGQWMRAFGAAAPKSVAVRT
jgi:asparagine synthase (glutamine-hydrolysing)